VGQVDLNDSVNAGMKGRTEHLFAYGTLQLEAVQMKTFGRRLAGRADTLRGFELIPLLIEDQSVVEISGKTQHTMTRSTGRDSDTRQ